MIGRLARSLQLGLDFFFNFLSFCSDFPQFKPYILKQNLEFKTYYLDLVALNTHQFIVLL